ITSLAKIGVAVHEIEKVTAEQNPATAHLFIINPRSGERMDNLFSTHPSTENRIAALEQLAAQMGVIPHFTSGAPRQGQLRTPHAFLALRTFLGAFFVACFAFCAMLKCSSFLPALIAAASQRGVSPRPAQVSLGFSGLRYFGATGPRTPSPLERNWEVESRESFVISASRVRRSFATLLCRAVPTWSLSFVSLSMDIDFRFISDLQMEPHSQKNACIYEMFVKRE